MKNAGRTKWTDITAIAISSLALIAFVWSARTNQQIIRNQNLWQEEIRKNQIFPDIRLTPETGFIDNYDKARIVFENLGDGQARDIFLWIGDENKIMGFTFHNFHPYNDPIIDQNYILPKQKVYMAFDAGNIFGDEYSALNKMDKIGIATRATWSFYFSYFDIDGNEYLQVLTEHPAGVRGAWVFKSSSSKLDSLLFGLRNSDRARYFNPGIRGANRWVKRELAE